MSQTFAENKINAEENKINADKINCCVCYNNSEDELEEGKKCKLIECCTNKHILCVECFHETYKRKGECPICRDLMYRPEIMTDVESFAYFGAKLALKQKREREEQQRQFRLAEAERQRLEVERQRLEAERRRQEEIVRLPIRKTERIQIIQRRNDELMRQIATNNAEIENINNLGLDEYNALYPEPRSTPLNAIISDSDSDSDIEIVTRPVFTTPVPVVPVVPVQQPVQQLVVRPVSVVPVQQPVTPVQRPVQQVARPVSVVPVQQVARPVQQPVTPVQQVARPVQQVARLVTTQEQIHQLVGRLVARPVEQIRQELIQSVARPVQQPVERPVQQPVERPVQQRRSNNYAYEKLAQGDILVQTLRGQGMVVRYDRLNDRFIRVSDNTVYPTLNRASAAHAEEVGLASTPNPWTTFKRLNGSSIDNL